MCVVKTFEQNRRWGIIALVTTLAVTLGSALAQGVGSEVSPAAEFITLTATPSLLQARPGDTVTVATEMRIAPDIVYYSPAQDPDAMTLPGGMKVTVSGDGPTLGENRWPADFAKEVVFEKPETAWSYKKSVTVFATITVSADAKPGEMTITLSPQGQICGVGAQSEVGCIQVQGFAGDGVDDLFTVTTRVKIAKASVPNPAFGAMLPLLEKAVTVEQLQANHVASRKAAAAPTGEGDTQAGEADEAMSIGFALGLAFLAGLTLNIMPCVLPVIPLRIFSIVAMAGESRRRFVTMGLAFAGGMMLFFVGIAVVNAILKLTTGQGFDLNQGFQQPWVIVMLVGIVLALAVNLLGVFNVIVPTKIASLDTNVQGKKAGHGKSVGMGVMLAVLATPCSFAYLAAALTYAQTQPLAMGTLVLLVIGLGMSLPHALLAAFPKLVDHLPKPGLWMELFKQSTGFILLLVVVYLLSFLRIGEASSYPFWVLGWCVVLSMGLWIWANWVRYDAPFRRKLLVRGVAVVLVAGCGVVMLAPPQPTVLAQFNVQAQPFDEANIAAWRAEGKVVVVKFTATWCLKCHQQDREIFETPEVAKVLAESGVVYVKADTSQGTLPAARWMQKNGFGSRIPMTIIYPPTGEPAKPIRALTKQQLIDAIREAKKRG